MTKVKTPIDLARAAQHNRGQRTKELILEVVKNSDQPLVAGEVQAILAQGGESYDRSYILTLLHEMTQSGLVSARVETPDEREIRTSDRRGMHLTSIYFWAPAGKVPFRTKASSVKLISRTTKKKSKSKKTTTAPASVSAPKSKDLLARIESMTSELALLQRVAELEQQLADIRKVVR